MQRPSVRHRIPPAWFARPRVITVAAATLLALGTGQVGILLGLGDHTTAVLGLTRAIGVFIIAILVDIGVIGGGAKSKKW